MTPRCIQNIILFLFINLFFFNTCIASIQTNLHGIKTKIDITTSITARIHTLSNITSTGFEWNFSKEIIAIANHLMFTTTKKDDFIKIVLTKDLYSTHHCENKLESQNKSYFMLKETLLPKKAQTTLAISHDLLRNKITYIEHFNKNTNINIKLI